MPTGCNSGAGRAAILQLAVAVAVSACSPEREPDAYGNMEATEVVVGAQATGQLESFRAVEGTRLEAGDVVGLIDASTLELQLRQILAQRTASASRVHEVTKQIGVLEAQLGVARRSYERLRRLFDAQAATAQQLEQAEREYRTLLAQIDAAAAQRETASQDVAATDARVAQIRDQIGKSRIVNPQRGTVLATYTKAGEFVQIGQPLYKIANLDTMELRAYVTEPQLAQVKIGQQVRVSVDAQDEQRQVLPGTVSWIASEAEFTPTPIETRDERSNLVFAIKVRVPNRNGILKIGMPADVQFMTSPPRRTALR